MVWKCWTCKTTTSPGFHFCSEKHTRQLYSRLMHQRAVIIAESESKKCAICGIQEEVKTNLDEVSFPDYKAHPVKHLYAYFERRNELHHTSRMPEKTIPLCVKCHRGVELGSLRPDLKPEMSRIKYTDIMREKAQQKRETKAKLKKEINDRMWKNRMYH